MPDEVESLFRWATLGIFAIDAIVRLALAVRIVARRVSVSDKFAWMVLLAFVPIVSVFFYGLIGESRLGSRRAKRYDEIQKQIFAHARLLWSHAAHTISPNPSPLERVLDRVSGIPGVPATSLDVIDDAQVYLDRLIADIDAAKHHVHLLYYIWSDDPKGALCAKAVARAAQRGVRCRVLVDSVGSADLLASDLVAMMRSAGASVVEALPANPLRAIFARIDLRNHRKVAVIDNDIAYCGSQNITEENFSRRRGKLTGPWLDASVRVTGPAALTLQATFVTDWALDSDEDMGMLQALIEHASQLPTRDITPSAPRVHLVASGPGPAPDAIHQAFLALLNGAQKRIILTTPYFVPDEATKVSLINAAYRGVDVTLVVPLVSDSVLVAAASRAHYDELVEAGVKIMLHQRNLMHAKTATVDDAQSLIGSANFDIRSFWLNFEATLFMEDEGFCDRLRLVQRKYIAASRQIELVAWRKRPKTQRFLDNCAQLLEPLL